MKTLSICTTLMAARSALNEVSGDEGPHALVLVHEAVRTTHQELNASNTSVFASTEDVRANGFQSPWKMVDAQELIRMITDSQRVHVR